MIRAVHAALAALAIASLARGAAPARVMILDGESAGPYHRLQVVTPVLKVMLAETHLFDVDVATAPPAGADYAAFKPAFAQYRALVLNYDAPGGRWPAGVRDVFVRYKRYGRGI